MRPESLPSRSPGPMCHGPGHGRDDDVSPVVPRVTFGGERIVAHLIRRRGLQGCSWAAAGTSNLSGFTDQNRGWEGPAGHLRS